MKIALAQLNYTVGAVQANKLKIINSIYKAKDQGADLVMFSEFAVSGMHCYDLLHKPQFIEACEVTLVEIASHCDGISALVGLPLHDAATHQVVSGAAFIQDRKVSKYIGRKSLIFRDDMGFISHAKGTETIVVAGEVCDVAIGSDTMSMDQLSPKSRIMLCPCGDRYYTGVLRQRFDWMRRVAFEKKKTFIGVNHLGGQVDAIFDGSSAVVDESGGLVALLNNFEEDFAVIDTSDMVAREYPKLDESEFTYNALKLGVRDYFQKNGFTRACLGMSGGIDSAVVYAIAADALGIENVRVIMMPSKFSSDHSVKDAVDMAERLGGQYDIIPIADIYDQSLRSMQPILENTPFGTTEENIQPRIRAMILMALSNKHGHILLNTSNKSEAAMGYGTLYGDMAGSLSVLGDVYKVGVYKLAYYINRNETVIPWNIIEKEPSAELRENQRDSDSLPPYNVLDSILYRFVEESQGVDDIINAGFDDKIVHKVLETVKFNAFKRYQFCPVLRVSRCTFGQELKLPLLNKYVL